MVRIGLTTYSRLIWREYADKPIEPDGPTDTLSTTQGRALLDAIHWRLPLTGTQRVLLETPVAAVLLSLVEGFRAKTLIVCRDCRRFVYRAATKPQLVRCPQCAKNWRSRLSKHGFRREYELALDRIRKAWKRSPGDRGRWSDMKRKCRAVDERLQRGDLSEREAIQQLRNVVPRSPRGRPRAKIRR